MFPGDELIQISFVWKRGREPGLWFGSAFGSVIFTQMPLSLHHVKGRPPFQALQNGDVQVLQQ